MVTMISLLKRREDLGMDEFREWYASHAEAATALPGLRRYVVSTAATPDQPYDAVSQLTFDDEDALQAAMDSPLGEESRADTRAHISDRSVLVVEQRELEIRLT